jgi:hypothetical protein
MDWRASRAPYAGLYEGKDQIRRMVGAIDDAWEEWGTEIIEAIEPDDETVLITTRVHARGKGSGITVEAHGASIWKFRYGLITRATLYQNKDEALAALDRAQRID